MKNLFLLFILIAFTSCIHAPKRSEVDATLWLNNSPIYKQYCDAQPALKDFGFYRKLNAGGFEFISFCDPRAANWIAIFKDDLQRLLDKYVPQNEKPAFNKEYQGLIKLK